MRWIVGLGLLATLLVAMALGLVLAWAVTEGIPPGTALVIDGERFEVGRLGALMSEHWFVTGVVLLFLAALIVVVVPMVLVLAIGLPLLTGALSLAVVLAPLGLLVWWLWRSPPGGATTMRR